MTLKKILSGVRLIKSRSLTLKITKITESEVSQASPARFLSSLPREISCNEALAERFILSKQLPI